MCLYIKRRISTVTFVPAQDHREKIFKILCMNVMQKFLISVYRIYILIFNINLRSEKY